MNDIELCQELMKRAEEYQKRKEREFAIEELEKIKAEISTEFKKYGGEWENGYNNGLKVVLTKVENHIAELKGENND